LNYTRQESLFAAANVTMSEQRSNGNDNVGLLQGPPIVAALFAA